TGIQGNVSLNGAGADNVLDGDAGNDVLIGNNGVVVGLAVLALAVAPSVTNTAIVSESGSGAPGGGLVSVESTRVTPPLVVTSLIGVLGNVQQTGVAGRVSIVGGGGRDSIAASAGDDILAGDNALVVVLLAGSALVRETGVANMGVESAAVAPLET